MPNPEKFNPFEYKKYEDLPEEKKKDFMETKDEGFVKKEAGEPYYSAKLESLIKEKPEILEKKLENLHENALKENEEKSNLLKEIKEGNLDAFAKASEKMRAEKEIVFEAVRQRGDLIRFVSEELKADREIALEAIKNDDEGFVFLEISPDLMGDKEIVLESVKKNEEALSLAPEHLKRNYSFLMKVAKENPNAIKYASKEVLDKILEEG